MTNRFVFRLLRSNRTVRRFSYLYSRNQVNYRKFLILKNLVNQFRNSIFKPIKLLSIATVMAATSDADLIKKVDELYDQNKFDEIETLLNNPDLLEKSDRKYDFKWRLARSRYGQVKEKQRSESELDAIRDLVLSSLEDNAECGPAHKWAAILVDEAAAKKGTKERIKQLLVVKDHMQKAIKYSPTDPTSLYLLAEWHYSCYNVSWAERQAARLIFGTLPEPDLEEALTCLKKAEELEPCFYSKNLVLLAKTLIALKKENDLAKDSLRKVVSTFEQSTKWDDVEAIKEAKSLLNKLGEKV